ncbi:unnamed protein product [Arabis nemorensis]|uniref:Uncharacterized protein n=1 Tax=Arabis nemorensis TaxID=586526 RepID=A0A565AWD3_9BRAS|nr:unnamed protein product [Arabis nemorensis]
MAWEVQPPRVQVALEGGAPLTLNRDLQFGNGDVLTICFRFTHDSRDCPERPRSLKNRGYSRRNGGEDNRRRGRDRSSAAPAPVLTHRAEIPQVDRALAEYEDDIAARRRKLIRRNLFGEDDAEASREVIEPSARIESAQNWAQKKALLIGEEKRSVKRPVICEVGDSSAGEPATKRSNGRRRAASTQIREAEEMKALVKEAAAGYIKAGWFKASVAEARTMK